MSPRDFWTIYDDDTRNWDEIREEERRMERERHGDLRSIMVEFILNKRKEEKVKNDHFEEEKDLFEV